MRANMLRELRLCVCWGIGKPIFVDFPSAAIQLGHKSFAFDYLGLYSNSCSAFVACDPFVIVPVFIETVQ